MSQTPGLMTQAEYARHRNVNRSYINRLAKRGILVLRGRLVDVADQLRGGGLQPQLVEAVRHFVPQPNSSLCEHSRATT